MRGFDSVKPFFLIGEISDTISFFIDYIGLVGYGLCGWRLEG
jgi:hypothetical protein